MKRFLAALLLTLILTALPLSSAIADDTTTFSNGEYLMAGENVVMYVNSFEGTELFTIPQTYYVKYIRNISQDVLLVSYHGITGILKSSENLSKVDEGKSVSETDSYYAINLLLKDETASRFFVIDEYETITETAISTADGLIFSYIGLRTYNEIPCVFVTEGARRGFIPVADLKTSAGVELSGFEIPIHPNSVVVETPPPEEQTPPTEPENTEGAEPSNNLLRVILIIGILVPAILIIVLLFKPANRKSNYDRNRNRNYENYGYDRPRDSYRDDPYYRERDDRRLYQDNYRRDNRPYDDDYYDRPRTRSRRQYDDDDYR